MNLTAGAQIQIKAGAGDVWKALIDPVAIQKYMFGATVTSEWVEGSTITWKGEWKGKPFEDRGEIRRLIPEQLLQYSHFSPLSGLAETPENFHTVTIELQENEGHTQISLTHDNNSSEEAKKHAEQNWSLVLESLKKIVEEQQP